MPRITKALPESRPDYSFGDLVYWHLFKFGTRPSIDPSATVGRVWEGDAICTLLGITDRTLRNWIFDRHLPDSIVDLCRELFGDNKSWDHARLELQERLEQARASKARRTAPRAEATPQTPGQPRPGSGEAGSPRPDDPLHFLRAEPSGQQHDQGPSPEPTGREEASASQDENAARPLVLTAPPGPRPPLSQKASHSIAVFLTIFAGLIAWFQPSRLPERPRSPPPKPVAEVRPPKPLATTEKKVELQPPSIASPPPQAAQPAQPPSDAKPEKPVQPPPPAPTEEEVRAAEQRRLAEKLVAARQAAHDLEVKRREQEAIRRDNEAREVNAAQRERETDTRMAAGLGYRLRENTAIAAQGFTHLSTSNVEDCLLACERNSCDAFAYYRDHYPRGLGKARVCYLYRKPYVTYANQGYVLGERTGEASTPQSSERSGVAGRKQTVWLAQNSPSAAPSATDGLTRCAGGPVKVTGFSISCDRIMGGGTTLGSTRLSYTVVHINECAAKCRPVSDCTAFTFNSADPEDRHACMIFGGKPESTEAKGWVSGIR
jgi:hypothetical protein